MRIGPTARRSIAACAAALTLLGTVALAGCDSAGKGVRPDGPMASAAASEGTKPRPPFTGPQPAAAAALRSYAVGEAGDKPLKGDWFSVPGLGSLNKAIETSLVSEFDGYLGGGRRFQPALFKPVNLRPATSYLNPAAPFPDPKYAGLQVQARVPVASGHFLLTQIDVATVGGAAPGVRTRGFITDTAADTTRPAHVLMDLTVTRAKIHAALVQTGRLSESAAAHLQLPDGLFDHVDFGTDGSLIVHFPSKVIDDARAAGAAATGAPPATGAATTVPPAGTPSPPATAPAGGTTGDAAIPLDDEDLSPLGRQVQESLSAPWVPPAAPTAVGNDFSCALLACVAVTYDDGPGPYTEKLLQELAAEKIHVSFFEIGQQVAQHPEITRDAMSAGHIVSSHTWNHPQLPHLSAAAIHSQMDRTAAALKKAGVADDGLMRPPYGAVNATVRREIGHAMILWDVDTLDWQNRNAAKTTQNVMAATRPGSIILMHDIHPTSVDAAPGIIDELRARGYHFVTVPELFSGIPLVKGQTYRCRSTRPGCTDR